MEQSPNIHTVPMGTPRRRFDFNTFDRTIGEVLASVPTTRENIDHIAAIEGSMHEDLDALAEHAWITHDELDVVLAAFHQRCYPQPELTVMNHTERHMI